MTDRPLAAKARESFNLSVGARLAYTLIQTGVTLALIRLLTPSDYGTYAVVASVVGLVNAFSCEHFFSQLLQVRKDEDAHLQDHFTAALAIQTGVFAVSNVVAAVWGMIAGFSGIPMYIAAMSPLALLSGIASFWAYTLDYQLNLRRSRALFTLGGVCSAVASVALAVMGFGVFALIVGPQFRYAPFIIDLFFLARWRPDFSWSWSNYAPAWRFGTNRLGATVLEKAGEMIQKSAFALAVGIPELGVFGRATGLSRISILQFSTVSMTAIYPVLTKIEAGSPRYSRASEIIFRIICWTVVPISFVFARFADVLIRTLFGEKWLGVIPLVPLAMAVGLVASLAACGYRLALGNNQHRRCLIVDAMRIGGKVIALPLLALASLNYYLGGLLVAEIAAFATLLLVLHESRAFSAFSALRCLLEAASACAIAALVLEVIRVTFDLSALHLADAIALGLGFAVAYVISIRCLFGLSLAQILNVAPLGRSIRRVLLLEGMVKEAA